MTPGPLAQKITELRVAKGLKKKGTKISASYMQKIENENFVPSDTMLSKLAKELDNGDPKLLEELQRLAKGQKNQTARRDESAQSSPRSTSDSIASRAAAEQRPANNKEITRMLETAKAKTGPTKGTALPEKPVEATVSPNIETASLGENADAASPREDKPLTKPTPSKNRSAAGRKKSAEKSATVMKNKKRKKRKVANRKRFKPASNGKSVQKSAYESEKVNRKTFFRHVKQGIDDWFAKATANQKRAVSYAQLCILTDQIEIQFVQMTGEWPAGVRGACDLARGYLNPDSIERGKLLCQGVGLLVTTAGGVAIVWGVITAFGIGISIWASLWAVIAGTTGPITGGITGAAGIVAVAGGIYYAIDSATPKGLSEKAHEVIIKAIDSWADQEQAAKNDQEAKTIIKAEGEKSKKTPPNSSLVEEWSKKMSSFKFSWPW